MIRIRKCDLRCDVAQCKSTCLHCMMSKSRPHFSSEISYCVSSLAYFTGLIAVIRIISALGGSRVADIFSVCAYHLVQHSDLVLLLIGGGNSLIGYLRSRAFPLLGGMIVIKLQFFNAKFPPSRLRTNLVVAAVDHMGTTDV